MIYPSSFEHEAVRKKLAAYLEELPYNATNARELLWILLQICPNCTIAQQKLLALLLNLHYFDIYHTSDELSLDLLQYLT
jgi:hypothetical protein